MTALIEKCPRCGAELLDDNGEPWCLSCGPRRLVPTAPPKPPSKPSKPRAKNCIPVSRIQVVSTGK